MKTEQPLPPGSRIVSYLRASGSRGQELSIPQQEAAIGKFCVENKYVLVRVFSDFSSGGTTVGRNQFLAMFDYLDSAPDVQGVIFWSYSRFARNYEDTQYYLALLRRSGLAVFSMTEPFGDDFGGRLQESVTALMDDKFRKDLSHRVREARRYLLRNYKAWMGGTPPLGYQRDEFVTSVPGIGERVLVRLVPDPEVAPRVVKAFEMRANGKTLSEIRAATQLTASVAGLGRMLGKSVYIGEFEYNDGEIVVTDYCEPIISEDLWQRASKVRQERIERHGYSHPRTVRSEFILTGICYCGVCGKPMHGRPHSNKTKGVKGGKVYHYYRCQSNSENKNRCGNRLVPQKELEQHVINATAEYLQSSQIEDAYLDAYEYEQRTANRIYADLTALAAEIDQTSNSINRIVSAIAEQGHSSALLESLETLENRKADLEGKAIDLEAQIGAQRPQRSLDDIKELAGNMRDVLQSGDHIDQAAVLQAVIESVTAERLPRPSGELVIKIVFRPLE